MPTRLPSRTGPTLLCVWTALTAPAVQAEVQPSDTVAAAARSSQPGSHRWAIAASAGGAISLPSLDMAVEAARRWQRFGVLVKVDWNRWVNTQKPPMLTDGTLNIGVGGEFFYFEGRARAALVAGP